MTRRLIVRSEAEDDLTEAAVWYENRESGLGFDLMAEVNSAIQLAVERPLSYLRIRKEPEVRRVLVHRFPYRIFSITKSDAVVVFVILHAARHDREWLKRL